MSITTITSSESFNEAIQSGSRVAIKYFATWCRPCKMFAPSFEAAISKYPELKSYQMDIEQVADVADELALPGLPTVQLYKDGKLFKTLSGSNAAALEEGLAQLNEGAPTTAATGASGAAGASGASAKKDVLINNVTELQAFVKKNSHTLIKCYADWCQPCRLINADWDKWASNPEYNQYVAFARVNVDADEELSELLGAASLPTFKFFADGKDVATLEGTDAPMIQGYVEKFVKKAIKFAGATGAPTPAAAPAPTPAPAPVATPAPAAAAAGAAEAKTATPGPSAPAGLATGSKVGLVPSSAHLPFITPYETFQSVIKQNTYTLVCFFAGSDKLNAAQTQVNTVLSSVSDGVAQIYVDSEKDVQLADAYGVFAEKCPVYKLLHKGIHFATLYQPTNDSLAAKLRELISL